MLARLALAATAAFFLLSAVATAAPGDLDSSFDGDGVAQFPSAGRLLGAAVQPDGKLVAVGEQAGSMLVVRFTAGGQPDQTFNGSGAFVGPPGQARGVAIQADGKIVVAAYNGSMVAMRLKPDGTPDSNFSGDGIATVLGDQDGHGLAVALQAGKVVVAGSARPPLADGDRVAVARFNADGSLDTGFGPGGARVYGFGRFSFANAVAIDGDNKIALAGSQNVTGQAPAVLAARLYADGSQDATFAANPQAAGYTSVPGLFALQLAKEAGYSAAFDVAIDAGNRVLLGGSATVATEGSDAIAVRLTSAGAPDTSFSGDGVAYLQASEDKDQYSKPEPYPGAYGIVLGGNDVLLGGYHDVFGQKQLAVWALKGNGTPDTGFGSGGHSYRPFGASQSGELNALAIAADGSLFGAGDVGGLFGGPTGGLAAKYVGVGPPVSPLPTPAPNPNPNPNPEPTPPQCFGKVATIVRDGAADTVRGTSGRDVIVSRAGDDVIRTLGGNDLVCPGAGNDQVFAGDGNDRVQGASGLDRLYGQGGNDELAGQGNRDRLYGGAGRDRLIGGTGDDLLIGGPSLDQLVGGPGDDSSRQ